MNSLHHQMMERMRVRSNHIRTTNIAMCTATSKDLALSLRLEAVRLALFQWQVGSFEYKNIIKQVPELLPHLPEVQQ